MTSIERRGVTMLFTVAAFGAMTALASAANWSPSLIASAPHDPGMHDLGRSLNVPVRMAVIMNYRNEGMLDAFLDATNDENSPIYGRILTSSQFRNAFSPTAAAYARTAQIFRSAGFTISHTFANRTILDISAPSAVVDRYFHTDIHRISINGMGLKYANATPAYMPAELRDAVYAIIGFDNIEWFAPMHRIARNQHRGGTMPLTAIGLPLDGPQGYYGPLAFAQGYDFPVQHQIAGQPNGTTYDGTGRTAGIAIPGDPSDTDLATFLTYFKITRTGVTTRVPVDGGPQDPSSDTQLEASLDYETISSLAPGADVDIFEFPTFDSQDVIDAYNTAVSDNIADTVNSSFGACETSGIFSATGIAEVFKQGMAQGQTFHSSSGDSGTSTYGCENTVSILTPTDTPYGLSIGGTRLDVDTSGDWVSEAYWNDGTDDAGGGGVSTVFKAPSWQKKAGIKYSGRAVPDISFDADPDTGIDMVFDGDWLGVGGTSLASPISGACFVEFEQRYDERMKKPLKSLYKIWHEVGYGVGSTVYAHDITTGNAYGILKPGPGYDLATGIGSLDCFNGTAAYFKLGRFTR